MFCCLVGDQRPVCRCNSLQGTINAIPLQISWLTESKAVNGQGCSTKPAIYFAQHQETQGTLALLHRTKVRFYLIFRLFFSHSLSHAHTHTLSLSLSSSPLLSHSVFTILSPLFPLFPFCSDIFETSFSSFWFSQCLFWTTILFTELLSFYSPRLRFCLQFPSSHLLRCVPLFRSFALLRCLV